MKNKDQLEEFDFGFSFSDEPDQTIIEQTETKAADYESRLKSLYAAILPFLDNLCKNPDKPSIHWPNRVEKIDEYKIKLQRIVEGEN